MQLIIDIDAASYRKHVLEQEGTPEEMLANLKDDVLAAIILNPVTMIGLAMAIQNGNDEAVAQLEVADGYVDVEFDMADEPAALTAG